ncbi:hypothetical protein AU485_17150 [Lonsdalea quercina]|uniref:Uncharacterized protein n=1 Tax=Lonsdalea quercina TaxID=71657 RepID=A0ACD1J8I1_9GAMM|nr:hypothetical protein AU485_17150 [Lonsdalea quercina]
MSQLNRDAENANEGAIDPIFDKEKEQKRLRQAQLVSDIASQSLDIYNTYESTKATHSETDNSVKTGVNAVVRALQALAGGDIKAALAQGAAPYLAEKVKEITTDNADYSTLTETQKLNNLMAHAILGGVVAELSGGNGAAGAISAATGELAAPAIALVLYGTSDSKELTSQQKDNISALATLASGIAGGVSSDSTAGAATGAQAGKNAVENNALSDGFSLPKGLQDYGQSVMSWTQYAVDNNLTPEQTQEGLNRIAIGEGPSWGTEYKVKPNGKVEVSGGVGLALKGGAEINNDYFSVSTGYTKEFGVQAEASVGIDFGPYAPGMFDDLNRDYSASLGFGPGSVGLSAGKDGIGFSFSIGPSIGFTGSLTGSHIEKIDLNGDSTKEIYHHDFK